MIFSENRYPLFGIMREKGRDLKHGEVERAMHGIRDRAGAMQLHHVIFLPAWRVRVRAGDGPR